MLYIFINFFEIKVLRKAGLRKILEQFCFLFMNLFLLLKIKSDSRTYV